MSGHPSRRLKDMAVIAPILGFVFLTPPIIGLFATDGTFLGAPVILVYLFSVWFGLIVIAAVLARRLARAEKNR